MIRKKRAYFTTLHPLFKIGTWQNCDFHYSSFLNNTHREKLYRWIAAEFTSTTFTAIFLTPVRTRILRMNKPHLNAALH
jgi:hypothetical protein